MLLPLIQNLDINNPSTNASVEESTGIASFLAEILNSFGLLNSTISIVTIIVIAFISKGILVFSALGYKAVLHGQLLRELKEQLFNCYNSMDYKYYASRDTGHFINIINDQIRQMLNAFGSLIQLGAQLVNTIVYLVFVFIVAWLFGLMI
ncbi:MAG: ABC transporter ATP-binding protein, partial [Bacteroidetes bacterium]|nr:ABC transporter ATP-binding protein [Bacteroidota bacterium]